MSMPMTHILNDALATDWMMTLEACQALRQIYFDALRQKENGSLRISDIEKLWAKHESEGLGEVMHMMRDEGRMAVRTEPMKGTSYTQTYKNIAIIDVIGPIVPRVRGMSSGSVGAQQIKNDFITAFESDDIKGILFNVDSPGGDARGISELAQVIQKARNKNTKPIYAYAAGFMASAAYFISAASHRIVANDWASVGSIGVVIGVPPRQPTDNIEFVSTASPYKRPDLSTDEGRQVYQEKADYLGQLFIEAVADLRGVTVEKVVNDFGKGRTLVGKQAKAAGLVDAIGTFDSTLHAIITSKPLATNQPAATEKSLSTESKAVVKEAVASGSESTLANGENSMADKKWYHKFFGSLSAEERTVAAEALTEAGTEVAPPPPPSTKVDDKTTAPPPPPPANESAELKELREKAERDSKALAELQGQVAKQMAEAREKAAETFAGDMVLKKKILPAEKDVLAAHYLQAAVDDAANPLAEGSRVEKLTAICNGLPEHNLTKEMVKTDLPAGASVLNPDGGDQEAQLAAAEENARKYAEKQNTNVRQLHAAK